MDNLNSFTFVPPSDPSILQVPELVEPPLDSKGNPVDSNTLRKIEYARFMRANFSPPTMLDSNFMINQDYFRPSRQAIKEALSLSRAKKWTEDHTKKLAAGIEKYGIGNWSAIVKEFLPGQNPHVLKMKAARLIGRQSLREYKGWRGNYDDIMAEKEFNFKIGFELGAWKSGYLVFDDDGAVASKLKQLRPNGPISPISADGIRRTRK